MRSTIRGAVGLMAAGALVLAVTGTAVAQTPAQAGGTAPSSVGAANVDPVLAAGAIANRYMQAPTRINQTVPLKVTAPKGKSIIMLQSGIPGTVLIGAGVEAAAKELGWNFQSINYISSNPADMQKAMLNALASKPDAVMISGANPDLYGASVIKQYADAKVPLIVGSQCPITAIVPPLFKGSNLCAGEEVMGKAFANWFIADSKGKGKALFENLPSIPVLTTFVNAFRAEVALKCPGCAVDVFETTLAQIGANQLVPALVNKLRADGTYGYVFLDNAQWGSVALANQLLNAGLGNIKVGGRSADAAAIGALQAGKQAAWTATPYYVAGYGLVDSALRVMTQSSGIDKNAVPPFQILTVANSSAVTVPYNAPLNALQQYMRIWKR